MANGLSAERTRGPLGVFGFASYLASEHDCTDCGKPAYHLLHDGEADDWLCADCACKRLALVIVTLKEGRGR